MGFSSYIIIGRRPTLYTLKSTNLIIWLGNWSTFLCFFPYFFIKLELDQDFNLSNNYPCNCINNSYYLIFLLGFGIKSLIYPFSNWLLYAMKGISIMSGLVHSLTIVFSGIYLLSFSWLEGWISTEHIELSLLPFLFSSFIHLYKIFYENNTKRILALSTAFSINLCHISLPWDIRFSFLYGLSHGFSKSFLFYSVQGKINILWRFIIGLLSGFPFSITWNIKLLFLHGKSIAFYFYTWCLFGYILLYLKFSLKKTNSNIKSYYTFRYGEIWSSYAVLISILFG